MKMHGLTNPKFIPHSVQIS